MKVWGLYDTRIGYERPSELIELFMRQEDAEIVRANLIGKQARRDMHGWAWEDDEDFPDLVIRELNLRGGAPSSRGAVVVELRSPVSGITDRSFVLQSKETLMITINGRITVDGAKQKDVEFPLHIRAHIA